MPGGQINDPSSGKHYSLSFLPATPSSLSRTREGLFELTRRPSRALWKLFLELQRYKDTVRCAVLGAEVPRHRQHLLTQNLIVRLFKTHQSSILKSQQNRIELVTRPDNINHDWFFGRVSTSLVWTWPRSGSLHRVKAWRWAPTSLVAMFMASSQKTPWSPTKVSSPDTFFHRSCFFN